jgi:hypothetical protein
MRPRRLSLFSKSLLTHMDLSQSFFTFLTHLRLFDEIRSVCGDGCSAALLLRPAPCPHTSGDIWFCGGRKRYNYSMQGSPGFHSRSDDVRCVFELFYYVDYIDASATEARGGTGSWANAEAFVGKKRRGEIRPSLSTPHPIYSFDPYRLRLTFLDSLGGWHKLIHILSAQK